MPPREHATVRIERRHWADLALPTVFTEERFGLRAIDEAVT